MALDTTRRVRWLSMVAAGCLALSACSGMNGTGTGAFPADGSNQPILVENTSASEPVIASSIYGLQVGAAAQRDRLDELAATVTRLREQTTTGWQARQNDLNGWAGEVSGGHFSTAGDSIAVATAFLDQYGELFGPGQGFAFSSTPYDERGLSTVSVDQFVGAVPVEGGSLVAVVRQQGNGGELQSIRGLLVDTSGVEPTPAITAERARASVDEAFGVEASPDPALVVASLRGEARLAWSVLVRQGPTTTGPQDMGGAMEYPAFIFVSASDGKILGARPAATSPTGKLVASAGRVAAQGLPGQDAVSPDRPDFGYYDFTIPPGGVPIVIESTYLGKIPIRVNAERLPDGSIILVDATGPQADKVTKKGLIVALDARTANLNNGYLGDLVRYPDVESVPADALYAMWGTRQTTDYLYRTFGRLSFDGQNSPIPIALNNTEGEACMDNAFFATAPGFSHMAVGVPCVDEMGRSLPTMAGLDVMAHELGHGVIHSSTDFARVSVQQGALDEGTADYLGIVLKNAVFGKASPIMAEDMCEGLVGYSMCNQWRDGVGLRSLNTGATFDQYLFTLEHPFRYLDGSDDGHVNSMVWTNALWQARSALAAADGGDPASTRVAAFDGAVIRAASTYFSAGTTMVQAAAGVLRAAGDVGMSAQDITLIADRFRANRLCDGCEPDIGAAQGLTPVSVSANLKSSPVALNDKVAFLLQLPDSHPAAVLASPGSPQQQYVGPPATVAVTLAAGAGRVFQGQVNLDQGSGSEGYVLGEADAATGQYRVLADDVNIGAGPAASDTALVWADMDDQVHFRPLAGGSEVQRDFDERVAGLATGGTRVAVLTAGGSLWVWNTAGDTLTKLAQLDPTPLRSFWPRSLLMPLGSMAMSGDRLAVVATSLFPGAVVVYDFGVGTMTTYSTQALPLGVAINKNVVVWVESLGPQSSPVNGYGTEDAGVPDTELRGYSFANQTYYRMVNARGQQGFPSLSDSLLTWQESANGNSDIYAIRLAGS